MWISWLGGKNVRKNQKGTSVIATGDGLLWADHSLQQNILAYYRVRSPFAQLLVSMTKDRYMNQEQIDSS